MQNTQAIAKAAAIRLALDVHVEQDESLPEASETRPAMHVAPTLSERDGEAPEYHDEASTRDRDPSDPSAMRLALLDWIDAQQSDDETERDEADAHLDATLLDLGVLSPSDAIDWITWNDETTTIGLAGGEEIRARLDTGELDA